MAGSTTLPPDEDGAPGPIFAHGNQSGAPIGTQRTPRRSQARGATRGWHPPASGPDSHAAEVPSRRLPATAAQDHTTGGLRRKGRRRFFHGKRRRRDGDRGYARVLGWGLNPPPTFGRKAAAVRGQPNPAFIREEVAILRGFIPGHPSSGRAVLPRNGSFEITTHQTRCPKDPPP